MHRFDLSGGLDISHPGHMTSTTLPLGSSVGSTVGCFTSSTSCPVWCLVSLLTSALVGEEPSIAPTGRHNRSKALNRIIEMDWPLQSNWSKKSNNVVFRELYNLFLYTVLLMLYVYPSYKSVNYCWFLSRLIFFYKARKFQVKHDNIHACKMIM